MILEISKIMLFFQDIREEDLGRMVVEAVEQAYDPVAGEVLLSISFARRINKIHSFSPFCKFYFFSLTTIRQVAVFRFLVLLYDSTKLYERRAADLMLERALKASEEGHSVTVSY